MWIQNFFVAAGILCQICQGRQFHLDAAQNVACLDIKAPTTIDVTRTMGQDPLPLLVFDYRHRMMFKNLPNFDFLTTDGKLEEYYEYGQFTLSKTDTVYTYNDILEDKPLSFDIDSNGVWCVYAPKIGSYEYKVSVDEGPGYYEKYDDIWYCIVNIVSAIIVIQLFFYRNCPIIFRSISIFQLIKIGIFLATAVLALLNVRVISYAENIVVALDEIVTLLFLMGYGLTYSKYGDENVNKILLIVILTVLPTFASRYFDLKTDDHFLQINNTGYTVVQGVLGATNYDGLSSVERLAREYRINHYSGPVALLVAFANLAKISVYVYAIRRTLKNLTTVNPIAKPYYKWTIALWLFSWLLVCAACAPDLNYSYFNIVDYRKVLRRFLLESLRNKYISFLWDESHWIVFRLIWFYKKGLLVDNSHVVEKKVQ